MKLGFEARFDCPVERLFAFHERPAEALSLIQDPRGWALIRCDDHIRPGARTEVLQRFGPLRFRMAFEHFLYEPPGRFGERLVKGPFAALEHTHEFIPDGEGTILRDRIELRLPLWLGGEATLRLLVAPKIRRVFAARHAALKRLVADGTVKRIAGR